jgi:hypothetical protein
MIDDTTTERSSPRRDTIVLFQAELNHASKSGSSMFGYIYRGILREVVISGFLFLGRAAIVRKRFRAHDTIDELTSRMFALAAVVS